MILVDTNIIIDFWNTPSDDARKIFLNEVLATCGVIKTELLRGSNSEREFQQIQNALNAFFYLNFYENDWVMLSNELIALKHKGISVPFQDAIIAHLAIKYNCKFWTNDKHFSLISTVLPLQLM